MIPLPLISGAIQTGIGLSQVAGGANKQSRANRDIDTAIGEIEDTRYADYNQAYYNELQRRESVGLPEAQRQYMEQQAERAAGVGLAQSYTNIGMADVAAREQNAQKVLGEMGQRGLQTYQEQMQLGQLALSRGEQARQEGLSQQQAGLQSTMTGLGTMVGLPQAKQTQDPYGQGTTQASVNPFSNYTPPQNLSLSQAYGTGLDYSPGMSGYGSGLETNYVSGIGSGGFDSGINTAFVPSGI